MAGRRCVASSFVVGWSVAGDSLVVWFRGVGCDVVASAHGALVRDLVESLA
ncbi:hypothetical protein ACXZ9C_10750 [Streptococcus agalactiae]